MGNDTKLTLEVGKYYRTRDGQKVGPMEGNGFKWVTGFGRGFDPEWDNDGTARLGAQDLIAEWMDEPKIWGEMSDAEKGALLLAHHNGVSIEYKDHRKASWKPEAPDPSIWHKGNAYRIAPPEPVVKDAELFVRVLRSKSKAVDAQSERWGCHTHKITFQTRDGEADCETIRMEKL